MDAAEDGGSGRRAGRSRGVRVGEHHGRGCQAVQVRGVNLHAWMTVHKPDPVIQIVRRDEQNVGLRVPTWDLRGSTVSAYKNQCH